MVGGGGGAGVCNATIVLPMNTSSGARVVSSLKSNLANLDQPNPRIQNNLEKEKKVPLFANLGTALTFRLFGVGKSSWALPV